MELMVMELLVMELLVMELLADLAEPELSRVEQTEGALTGSISAECQVHDAPPLHMADVVDAGKEATAVSRCALPGRPPGSGDAARGNAMR